MKSVARFVLFGVLASWCCSAAAAADAYPSRTVKFLVPQAPGGATDVFARKVAQMLTERWGQPVIVENRAGAAGVVGTEAVAKATPDGYTLLVTYAGSQAVNPSLYPNLSFDSIQDFQAATLDGGAGAAASSCSIRERCSGSITRAQSPCWAMSRSSPAIVAAVIPGAGLLPTEVTRAS